MSERQKRAYKKGTQDGASGKEYIEPNSALMTVLKPWAIEENEAYKKGYYYGKGQKDGYENKYHDSGSGSEQYKKGWDNGYSQSEASSGCFITTATFEELGKSDDCKELELLRDFRDKWLIHQPNGLHMVNAYYIVAPKIVATINTLPQKKEIYKTIWNNSIKPCLKLLSNKEYEKTKQLYCKSVLELASKYYK